MGGAKVKNSCQLKSGGLNVKFLEIFVETPPTAEDFRKDPNGNDRVAVTWQSDAGTTTANVLEVRDTTGQIKNAGEILGIELLDHVIFNRSSYFSFLEIGIL